MPRIFALEVRIVRQHVLGCRTRGELIENQRNPDAGAADARFAETDVRIDANALEQSIHGVTLRGTQWRLECNRVP